MTKRTETRLFSGGGPFARRSISNDGRFNRKGNGKMRNLKPFAYGVALSLALSVPAFAQVPAKPLAENSKAVVTEGTLAAGASVKIGAQQGAFLSRYYLSGGTLEYTYADGKKETITRKTGSAVIILPTDKRPDSVKNIGTTALHFITVSAK